MSIIEKAKEHPYATTAVVLVGALALYMVLGSSGGSPTPSAVDPNSANDVAAATQAYAIDKQVQQSNAANAAALAGQQQQIGGALSLAQINAATTSENNNLIAGVDLAQINSASNVSLAQIAMQALGITTAGAVQTNATDQNANTTNMQNSLTAQVAESNIAASLEAARIASATTIASNQIIAGALTTQNNNLLESQRITAGLQLTQINDATNLAQQANSNATNLQQTALLIAGSR